MDKKTLGAILALAFFLGSASVQASTGETAAASSTGTTAVSSSTVTTATSKTVDVACIQSGIDVRDSALVTGVDTYASAVKSALEARKTALKEAWSKTIGKERLTAIWDAWKIYKNSLSEAKKALKKARADAWKTFSASRKTCKATDDTSSSGLDGF
jgi:hypothetical protein